MAKTAAQIRWDKAVAGQKKEEQKEEKKEVFRVENPLGIEYDERSMLMCDSALGKMLYTPIRGNARVLRKFREAKIKDIVLTITKNTGRCQV